MKPLQNYVIPLHNNVIPLHNYVITSQNYVIWLQNYVRPWQNYWMQLQNYVKPCKAIWNLAKQCKFSIGAAFQNSAKLCDRLAKLCYPYVKLCDPVAKLCDSLAKLCDTLQNSGNSRSGSHLRESRFFQKIVTRHRAPIVQVLWPAEKSAKTICSCGRPAFGVRNPHVVPETTIINYL